MKTKDSIDYSSAFIKKFIPHDEIDKDFENKYHYTSPYAFLSIIKDESVRFTDIRFLNDRSEGIYLVKLICDYFRENPQKYPKTEDAFNGLIRENKYKDIQDLSVSEILYSTPLPFSKTRHFVFCMCDECDSLHMWNYYANNGVYQGYNIGIKVKEFLQTFSMGDKALDPFIVYYGNVLYKKTDQYKEIESWFNELEHKDNSNGYINMQLKLLIDRFCAFFKSSKFSDEKEFRIVIEISDERVSRIESINFIGKNNKELKYDFCEKNGLIVPFISVRLIKSSFERITISPIMESDITQESIRELLRTKQYKNCKVYQSKIPIRF